jgi:hypothetical protein
MKNDLKLYIQEFDDDYLKENFRKLKDFVDAAPSLNASFKFFEIVITGNKTNLKFKHNFNFVPKDIIQTSVVFSGGAGTLTWNYSRFDSTFLDLTTAGMGATDTCTVRALVGRF